MDLILLLKHDIFSTFKNKVACTSSFIRDIQRYADASRGVDKLDGH